MKLLLSIIMGLTVAGAAHASVVHLLNGSPQQGKMSVQYQMLYSNRSPGSLHTVTLPKTITLAKGANGLTVKTLTNAAVPMPGHQFTFPRAGCKWTVTSIGLNQIIFSTANHQISCTQPR